MRIANQRRPLQKMLLLGLCIAFSNLISQKTQAQFYDFEKFNGSELENLPTSFSGNQSITIKNLHFGSGDTLWIGTYKDGLVKWWEDNFTNWYLIDTLPGNEVYHVIELKSPTVFFTDYNSFTNTYSGLYRLNSTYLMEDTPWVQIPFIANNPLRHISKINDLTTMGDSLVLFTTDSGLVTFDGFTNWQRTNKDNTTNITKVAMDQVVTTSKGGIYLSSGSTVFRKLDKNWEEIELSEEPYNLKSTSIKEMRVGPADTVWAITSKGVAKIHTDGGFAWLNSDIKKNLNEVKDVAFDDNGYPWMLFELNGGLRYLSEEDGNLKWHQVNSTNSDLPDEMSAIAIDSKGNVWLGTDSDGMFRFLSYTPATISSTLPNGWKVFPNPSNGLLQITQIGDEAVDLELVDLKGHAQSITMESGRTSISLDKGMYVLIFREGGNTYHQKVVIY